MPSHLRPFQSASLRLTKSQQQYNEISELIIQLMSDYADYTDAETLWLVMKEKGLNVSISTFYSRLRLFIENGIMEKQTLKYNKNAYRMVRK
jgi:Fe2+ or Zn2+ uptake regulation protein